MSLLVAQTMATELLLGGRRRGVLGRLFQPSNFFIKRGTAVFLPLLLATTTFALKPRRELVCISSPCCSCRRVFFFPLFFFFNQSSLPYQNCVALFCQRRRPGWIWQPVFVSCALSLILAPPAALITQDCLPFMLIVSLS